MCGMYVICSLSSYYASVMCECDIFVLVVNRERESYIEHLHVCVVVMTE